MSLTTSWNIIVWSFLGLITSGLLHIMIEAFEQNGWITVRERFWKNFTIGFWIMALAFGAGVHSWLFLSFIQWSVK